MGSQRAGLNWAHVHKVWGFPDGSAGKESTCNAGDAGDLGSVPRLGRSPGGGNGNPLQYSCLKISWPEEPGSPWVSEELDMSEWLSTHTGSAQLNTIENSFWQRTCFWVRKFNSKGNFKDFLEDSLVFVGGHRASDNDSFWPQAVLAGHYAPRVTVSTWVNIPYQPFSLVLKLAVISTLNGAGMKEKVERKGSLGGKHFENLTQPTSYRNHPQSESNSPLAL